MKKRSIFNLVLVLLILFLVFVLYKGIEEPIAFQAEKQKRDDAVVGKLMEIRTAQELYRGLTGGFAPNFDTLQEVLVRDTFKIVNIIGDPDDPNFTGEIVYDTLFIMSADSLAAIQENKGILTNLDSLPYVPFGKGEKFMIDADTMTYQKTLVNVVQVGVSRKVYMGQYADARYQKYDDRYNPNETIKFGDLTKPTLAGNWESN